MPAFVDERQTSRRSHLDPINAADLSPTTMIRSRDERMCPSVRRQCGIDKHRQPDGCQSSRPTPPIVSMDNMRDKVLTLMSRSKYTNNKSNNMQAVRDESEEALRIVFATTNYLETPAIVVRFTIRSAFERSQSDVRVHRT